MFTFFLKLVASAWRENAREMYEQENYCKHYYRMGSIWPHEVSVSESNGKELYKALGEVVLQGPGTSKVETAFQQAYLKTILVLR